MSTGVFVSARTNGDRNNGYTTAGVSVCVSAKHAIGSLMNCRRATVAAHWLREYSRDILGERFCAIIAPSASAQTHMIFELIMGERPLHCRNVIVRLGVLVHQCSANVHTYECNRISAQIILEFVVVISFVVVVEKSLSFVTCIMPCSAVCCGCVASIRRVQTAHHLVRWTGLDARQRGHRKVSNICANVP